MSATAEVEPTATVGMAAAMGASSVILSERKVWHECQS
jgi:hypothetical protein